MRPRPSGTTTRSGSWLYGIAAYRRLFPPAYLATAHPSGEGELRYLSLWGQFLDHRWRLKPDLAEAFRQRLRHAEARSVADLQACLPHPVWRLEAPVSCFYTHFGV